MSKRIKTSLLLITSLYFIPVLYQSLLARVMRPQSGLIFNHEKHITEKDLACDQCHDINEKNPRFVSIPNHKVCGSCHKQVKEDSPDTNCQLCHSRKDNKTFLRKNVALRPIIKFNHEKHDDKDIKCQTCHTKASISNQVDGNEMLPVMASCVKCHLNQKKAREQKCDFCHPKQYQRLRPSSHIASWQSNHGKNLTQNDIDNSCKTCHNIQNGNDCMTCHRREKPPNHTIAWRLRVHAQRAQLDRKMCSTCHNQASCVQCHSKEPPMSHVGGWGAPTNRHCYSCHLEGSNSAGSLSFGIGSNCSFCHGARMISKHLSSPSMLAIAGFPPPNNNCLSCHKTGGPGKRAKHVTTGVNNCRACHR